MRALILLWVFVSTLSQAEVFKWVDPRGNVHFGDAPPAERAWSMPTKTSRDTRKAPSGPSKEQIEEAYHIAACVRDRRAQVAAERELHQQQCEQLATHKTKLEGGGFFYQDDVPRRNAFTDDQLAAEIARVQRLLDQNCPAFAVADRSN
jgi:hypothetical protein